MKRRVAKGVASAAVAGVLVVGGAVSCSDDDETPEDEIEQEIDDETDEIEQEVDEAEQELEEELDEVEEEIQEGG